MPRVVRNSIVLYLLPAHELYLPRTSADVSPRELKTINKEMTCGFVSAEKK